MNTSPQHSRSYPGGAPNFLYQHRAIARLPRRPFHLLRAVGLALLLTATWLWVFPVVGHLWGFLLAFCNDLLALPGEVVMTHYTWADLIDIPIPHLNVAAGLPSLWTWGGTALLTLILFVATFFLPERLVPLIYFLRAVVLIQATALLYFGLTPEAFPYTLPQYLSGLTATGFFVTLLVPLVLGFTYYLLDFRFTQKLGLTILILGYLSLFIPIQYAAQAYLIHTGSLLFMPVLYLLFGLPLDVMIFIALYAWGMSWPGGSTHQHTTPLPGWQPAT